MTTEQIAFLVGVVAIVTPIVIGIWKASALVASVERLRIDMHGLRDDVQAVRHDISANERRRDEQIDDLRSDLHNRIDDKMTALTAMKHPRTT